MKYQRVAGVVLALVMMAGPNAVTSAAGAASFEVGDTDVEDIKASRVEQIADAVHLAANRQERFIRDVNRDDTGEPADGNHPMETQATQGGSAEDLAGPDETSTPGMRRQRQPEDLRTPLVFESATTPPVQIEIKHPDRNPSQVAHVGELAVYEDAAASVAIESSSDDLMSIYTVLHGPEAPSLYDFRISLVDGASLVESNGSFGIMDDAGNITGLIAPAWALDADGVHLPTSYSLSGDVLTLRVDHSKATYPVIADPSLGGYPFNLAEFTWCTVVQSRVNMCTRSAWFASGAIRETVSMYGHNDDGTRANAFQHCLWNARMTDAFGRTNASYMGTNHETFPENSWVDRTMDMQNNLIGRDIGSWNAAAHTPTPSDLIIWPYDPHYRFNKYGCAVYTNNAVHFTTAQAGLLWIIVR